MLSRTLIKFSPHIMDLILFGIQGSGKGTQGKYLLEKYNMVLFEAGGALRKIAEEDNDLGGKVKSIIEAGHLVPTEIIMEIAGDFMSKLPEGKSVLFDGLVRKLDQAEQFEEMMQKAGRDFLAILIEISKEEAIDRLINRRICPKCKTAYPKSYNKDVCAKDNEKLIIRKDDNAAGIENRLNAFFSETVPAIEKYKKEGKMITINGEQNIENVTQELMTKLEEKL